MKAKAQHYLPQFYLKGFVDPRLEKKRQPMLWVYEAGKQPRKSLPKNVAFENYLYVPKVESGIRANIENRLAAIESDAARIVRRISNEQFKLSSEERNVLGCLVALTFSRVPSFRDETNQVAAKLLDVHSALLKRDSKAFARIKNEIQEWSGAPFDLTPEEERAFLSTDTKTVEVAASYQWLDMMFRMMWRLTNLLGKMYLVFCVTGENEPFLTSDNPVALYDPTPPKPGVVGFGSSPNAEVTFPISRSTCLLYRWRGGEGIARLKPIAAREVNRRTVSQAYRYIYAPQCSIRLRKLVDKLHRHRREGRLRVSIRQIRETTVMN